MNVNPKYKKYFTEHQKLTSEKNKKVCVIHYNKFEDFFKELSEDEDIPILTKAHIALLTTGGLRISEMLNLRKQDFFEKDGKLFATSDVLKKKYLITYKQLIKYRSSELDYKNASEAKISLYETILNKWMEISNRTANSRLKEEFGVNYEDKMQELYLSLGQIPRGDIDRVMNTYKRTANVLKKNPPKGTIPKRYIVIHDFVVDIVKKLWTERIIGRPLPKPNEILFKRTNKKGELKKISRAQALKDIEKYMGSDLTNHSLRHSFVSFLLFNKKKTTEEVSELTKLSVNTVKNYQHYNSLEELSKLYD